MAWGNFTNQGGGGRRKFVTEGNIEVLMIPAEKARIKILTQDVDVLAYAKEKNISEEQANEEIMSTVAEQKWVIPKAIWMHAIPSIPNVRFFSQVQCGGVNNCKLCMENSEAVEKAGGALENRDKPYPIRKRYVVPVWSYDLERVLYLLQNEQYFSDIKTILDQFGPETDLFVWKEGAGMRTNYKVMYAGPAQMAKTPDPELSPAEVDLYPDAQELARRLGSTQRQPTEPQGGATSSAQNTGTAQNTQEATKAQGKPPEDTGSPGDFVVPFGNHKGQTLKQIADVGDIQYLEFLRDSAGGLLKDKVTAFLAEINNVPY